MDAIKIITVRQILLWLAETQLCVSVGTFSLPLYGEPWLYDRDSHIVAASNIHQSLLLNLNGPYGFPIPYPHHLVGV